MPRIWQAAMNDRNVRVEGCVKYSIARLCGSRLIRKSCPARLLESMRIMSAMPASSSRNGDRELAGEDDVPNPPVPLELRRLHPHRTLQTRFVEQQVAFVLRLRDVSWWGRWT